MTGRPHGTRSRAAQVANGAEIAPSPAPRQTPSRSDRLVEMIDHLSAAKQTSDALGEKFLSYLLSMAIQETRVSMRNQATAPDRERSV